MPHPRPYPTCIFCGAKADSREHAIPKWIGKRLGIKGFLYPVYLQQTQPRKQPISFRSHRARIFCKACNKHFKSLEDEAADLITWMARGRAIRLGVAEQGILARWGAKTGYALLAAETETREAVPVEHRRMLRDNNIVHPNTWVGYTSWSGGVHKIAYGEQLIDATYKVGPSGLRTYGAMLTFAQLAFKIFGLIDPLPPGLVIGGYEAVSQVAPRLDRVIAWPMIPGGDENLQTMVDWIPLKRAPQPPKPPITP